MRKKLLNVMFILCSANTVYASNVDNDELMHFRNQGFISRKLYTLDQVEKFQKLADNLRDEVAIEIRHSEQASEHTNEARCWDGEIIRRKNECPTLTRLNLNSKSMNAITGHLDATSAISNSKTSSIASELLSAEPAKIWCVKTDMVFAELSRYKDKVLMPQLRHCKKSHDKNFDRCLVYAVMAIKPMIIATWDGSIPNTVEYKNRTKAKLQAAFEKNNRLSKENFDLDDSKLNNPYEFGSYEWQDATLNILEPGHVGFVHPHVQFSLAPLDDTSNENCAIITSYAHKYHFDNHGFYSSILSKNMYQIIEVR